MPQNPHEYDDESYTRGSLALTEAIGILWEAGASIQNIETEAANALENADVGERTKVSITVEIDGD